jgi:ornithine cyclodeaminase/alanine dehydrogenase-like protein (mu-crystallin family)
VTGSDPAGTSGAASAGTSGAASAEVPFLDGARLRALVPMTSAVVCIEAALSEGSAPGGAPPRTAVLTGAGEVLLMPAATSRFVGVKLVTVAPDNPALGLPRVQGIYVLLDGRTLTPVALLDGVALTALRTPAVSAVALRHLSASGPVRVVVIGTGPQGYGHLEGVLAVRQVTHVTVAGRDRAKAERMAMWCRGQGLPAAAVAGSDLPEGLEGPIRSADVVVCATSSRWPVFDSHWLAGTATVIAVGSHEPDSREVDAELVARANVIVETRGSALREAGDIVLAMRELPADPGVITSDLGELVRGLARLDRTRPSLFKSVGEAWEDLVVAAQAYDQLVGS